MSALPVMRSIATRTTSSLDAIACTELLGSALTHVPATDPGRNSADLIEVIRQCRPPLHGHVGIGRFLEIHHQANSCITAHVLRLGAGVPRVEHDVAIVDHEPDRGHMRRPVCAGGRNLARPGPVHEERECFVVGHVSHTDIKARRPRSVPGNRADTSRTAPS